MNTNAICEAPSKQLPGLQCGHPLPCPDHPQPSYVRPLGAASVRAAVPVNRSHSAWLATVDSITRQWARDLIPAEDARALPSGYVPTTLDAVNRERAAVGLSPLYSEDI